MCPLIVFHKTTTVTPAATTIFRRLRRPPFPGPVELHTRAATRCVVSYKLHIRILMQIRVGVEFSHHQILHLFRTRCKDVRQAGDLCVEWGRYCVLTVRVCAIRLALLSGHEGEVEVEVIDVAKSDQERWWTAICDALWILLAFISPCSSFSCRPPTHLYVINRTVMALLLLRL